jgi:RNA polymerase sigma-70 factor, ECF subfamily
MCPQHAVVGGAMKISVARMIANLAARGRALGNRFAWWSRWFPPARTVDADRFQGDGDPYPDHWKEFPRPRPAGRAVEPEALRAALAALPDPWRRVVTLRDVHGRPPTEVSAATGLTAEQQRDMLNRARAQLREDLGRTLERDGDGS